MISFIIILDFKKKHSDKCLLYLCVLKPASAHHDYTRTGWRTLLYIQLNVYNRAPAWQRRCYVRIISLSRSAIEYWKQCNCIGKIYLCLEVIVCYCNYFHCCSIFSYGCSLKLDSALLVILNSVICFQCLTTVFSPGLLLIAVRRQMAEIIMCWHC